MKLKQLMLPGMMLLTFSLPSAAVDTDELVKRCEELTRAYKAATANYIGTVDRLLRIRNGLATLQHGENIQDLISLGTAQRNEVLRLSPLAEEAALQVIALHESREAKNQ